VAVVQPLPGIGDMIWHIPHIHALAAHLGGPVTVVAKASALADQLFAGDPAVAEVVPVARSERGPRTSGWAVGRTLRGHGFRRVYVLHHGRSLALGAVLAGIPERFGYGFGRQRWFLNRGPFLPPEVLPLHPFDQATRYLRALGVPMLETEPRLAPSAAARAAARARLGVGGERFAVLGIGTSEPYKQWGAENFAALARRLFTDGMPVVALLGGPREAALAGQVRDALGAAAGRAMPVLGWDLGEVAALCAEAAFYVGNDTAALNLSAAVGTRSIGVFGATPPFAHASAIVPVLPADGRIDRADGMARIGLDRVLAALIPP
jgi:heptosyltransferase II